MDLKQVFTGSWLLCLIWIVAAEEAPQVPKQLPQFPSGSLTAQKRFDFKGSKGSKGGSSGGSSGWGWGSGGGEHESQPQMGGGFGMYPLWKFHKFDGFSLRPVPIQLDIGHGIPAPPPSVMPSYSGSGWGSGGQSYGGGSSQSYGGSSGSQQSYAPSGGYGSLQQSSYGQQSSPSYGGQQQQQSSGYSSGYGQQQVTGGYGGSYNFNQAPLTMSYQPAPQQSSYGTQSQPSYGGGGGGGYSAPQPNYGSQQTQASPSYSAPQAPPSYSVPQAPSYSAPQTQSYSAPMSQDMNYAASNAQPVATVSGGGFGSTKNKIPSYAAAFDGNAPFGAVSELSMPMESNQGAGGYVKRYYSTESESSQQTPGSDDKDAQQQQ